MQFSTIFLFFILFRHKPLFSAVTFSNFYGKDCRYYFSEHIFKIKSNKSWDFYLKSEKVVPPPAHLNKMLILSPVPSLIERTQFQSGPVEAHLLQEVEGKIKIKDFTFLFAFLLCASTQSVENGALHIWVFYNPNIGSSQIQNSPLCIVLDLRGSGCRG